MKQQRQGNNVQLVATGGNEMIMANQMGNMSPTYANIAFYGQGHSQTNGNPYMTNERAKNSLSTGRPVKNSGNANYLSQRPY